MNKMYLVKYSTGSYEDYHQNNLFVTADKEVADKYVEKFNRILDNWLDYMTLFDNEHGYRDDEKCTTAISQRYYDVIETNGAFVEEIEVR